VIEIGDYFHAVVVGVQPAAQTLRRDFMNEFRERVLTELTVHPATYLSIAAEKHKMIFCAPCDQSLTGANGKLILMTQ
jgi:hypothetical protein